MADYPQTLLEIVHHIVHQHPPLATLVEQVAVAAQGRNSSPQPQRKVLDPTTVTEEEARAFFQQAANMNNSLVQSIAKELGRAKVVFDVGANSGFFSKAILDTGFKGQLVLFEPISNLIAIAAKILAPYPVEKIFVNGAAGESNGELELFLPNDSNIGWITAVGEKATGQRSIKTRVVDLAPYLAAFRPDLVKIDVEGFELFVLRPFLSVLSDDYQPSFLVELGWGVSNPHWDGFMRFSREVAARGYLFVEALTGRELSLTELSTLKQTVDVVIRPRLERSERFRALSEGRVGTSLFNPQ